MALQAIESQLREMVQCKICFEDKDVQKQLPCQHTLCLECLTSLKLDDSKYKCPLCQQECYVPNGGFEALPDSLVTKQLASIMHAADMANTVALPSAGTTTDTPSHSDVMYRKCQPMVNQAEQLLESTNDKTKAYKELEENLIKNGEAKKQEIISLRDAVVARADIKIQAIDEVVELKRSKLSQKLEKLSMASSSTRESVEKLKSLQTTAAQAEDLDENLKEVNEAMRTLRDETLKHTTESHGKLQAGDSVRLRIGAGDIESGFMNNDLTHMSVGYIHVVVNEEKCTVIFPGDSAWIGKTSDLCKADVKHDLPVIGDSVRVKASVEKPCFGWGKIKSGDIGVLTELKNQRAKSCREVCVDFPNNHSWKGIFDELEKVPPEPIQLGEKVWIAKGVDEPVRGWCGVTFSSVGTLLYTNGEDVMVNFPECKDWKGLTSEIERVRTYIIVGDKVKVKKSVKEPTTGWAGITHENIGVVKGITDGLPSHGKLAHIDFPHSLGLWKCLVSELEMVDRGGKHDYSSSENHGNVLEALQKAQEQAMRDLHEVFQLRQSNTGGSSGSSSSNDSDGAEEGDSNGGTEATGGGDNSNVKCQTQ